MGEGTPVGPWPPCCPQWSLHVRFLLAGVTVGQLLRCLYSGYSRTVGRLNCLCPVSARTCLKASGWAFAVPSSWVFQEPGSAEHGFRSRCKPRAHGKVQRELNLGAAVVCLAIIKTFSRVSVGLAVRKSPLSQTPVWYLAAISRFEHVLHSAKKPGRWHKSIFYCIH